jgi:hypothetical protein
METETWPMWGGTCVVEEVGVTFRGDGKTEVVFVMRGGGREGLVESLLRTAVQRGAARHRAEKKKRKEARS